MAEITLTADQTAAVGDSEIVGVRDQTGRLIGHVLPDAMYRSMFVAWARSEVTRAELDAAAESYRQNGGIDGSEVVAYIMKKLGRVPE